MQVSNRCVIQIPAQANILIKSQRISEFVWDISPVAGTTRAANSTSELAKSSNLLSHARFTDTGSHWLPCRLPEHTSV